MDEKYCNKFSNLCHWDLAQANEDAQLACFPGPKQGSEVIDADAQEEKQAAKPAKASSTTTTTTSVEDKSLDTQEGDQSVDHKEAAQKLMNKLKEPVQQMIKKQEAKMAKVSSTTSTTSTTTPKDDKIQDTKEIDQPVDNKEAA